MLVWQQKPPFLGPINFPAPNHTLIFSAWACPACGNSCKVAIVEPHTVAVLLFIAQLCKHRWEALPGSVTGSVDGKGAWIAKPRILCLDYPEGSLNCPFNSASGSWWSWSSACPRIRKETSNKTDTEALVDYFSIFSILFQDHDTSISADVPSNSQRSGFPMVFFSTVSMLSQSLGCQGKCGRHGSFKWATPE